MADSIGDGAFQFSDTLEGSSTDAPVGDVPEPAFNQIEPGGGSGKEVEAEAGMLFQPGADLLTMPCDILIPAATENVITSHNAAKISARIVCEGANGPTTAFADDILGEKGVFIIPDILANAGGVTASYFEWCRDISGRKKW